MSRRESAEHKHAVKLAAQERYRAKNREKLRLQCKKYREEGREKVWQKTYYEKNRKQLLASQKTPERRDKHRKACREYMRRNRVPLHISDPEQYQRHLKEKIERLKAACKKSADKRRVYTPLTKHIRQRLRSSIYNAIKRQDGIKQGTVHELLGVSIAEFRDFIAVKFKEGMSWDNYGEWELDHKRPVSSFDLTSAYDQFLCFHYTNYQPLWRTDNRKKGAKYEIRPRVRLNERKRVRLYDEAET
jgi:hypothetical protein